MHLIATPTTDKPLSRADRRKLRAASIAKRRELGIRPLPEPVPLSVAIAEVLARLGLTIGGGR